MITGLLALVALIWVVQGIRASLGMRKVPWLRDVTPAGDAGCPFISILFSARDEEKKLPQALATLLALDYPRYEVVAVNDRSADATGRILDQAAARDPRLKVVHIDSLPPGWLGKPHGLQKAYEVSSGEWLIFTDADVRFATDLPRRALALAQAKDWDHLVLLGRFDLTGWGEKALAAYLASLAFWAEPWQVSNPRSRRFIGAGYFQLLRRSAYEAIGTHRRLAMEVVDDLKLGKLVKQGGFASGVAFADEAVRLRYTEGVWDTVRNFEKNGFALGEFSVWKMLGIMLALLLTGVFPFAALPFVTGWALAFASIAALIAVTATGISAYLQALSPLFGLTHSLAALVACYTFLRSMVLTLRQGGIVWRDTFYSLAELRKGIV